LRAFRHIAGPLAALLCLASANANANADANAAAGADVNGDGGGGTIYVVRRGWHIEVGFASTDIDASLAPVVPEFAGGHVADLTGASDPVAVRYLFFGFGDRRYLLSKHRNGPVLLAALWPGAGMMLVTALGSSPEAAFGPDHVIALKVTREQLRGTQAAIRASIGSPVSDSLEGRFRPYAPGPYQGSFYFSTAERYSALHTCNTWAAEVLQAGELPLRSPRVVFASQVWRQLKRLQSLRQGVRGRAPAETSLLAHPS
jgi:hypothetical protein